MIVVNPTTRQFNIPGADLVFGVTIECEYSRDTNKVIEDILNKLAALMGNN